MGIKSAQQTRIDELITYPAHVQNSNTLHLSSLPQACWSMAKMTLRLLPKALWENVKMICLAALRWKLLNVSWQGHMEANICKHHMQSIYNETWGRTCALPSCMTQGSAKMVAPSLEVDVPSLNHHMCNCNSSDFSLLQKIVVQRRNLSPLAKLLDEHLLNSTNYSKNQFGFMGWAISCHVDGQANIGDFNSILLPLALMRPWYSYLGSAHVGSSALSKESKITFSLVMHLTRGTRPSNAHNKIWAANGVQVVGDTKDGTNTQSVCDQQAMSHPPDLVVYNWSIHPCWRMIGGRYCGLSVGQTEQKNQQSRTKHWQAPGTNWPHMATGCGFDRFLRNANFIDPPWGTANTLRWRTDPLCSSKLSRRTLAASSRLFAQTPHPRLPCDQSALAKTTKGSANEWSNAQRTETMKANESSMLQ